MNKKKKFDEILENNLKKAKITNKYEKEDENKI